MFTNFKSNISEDESNQIKYFENLQLSGIDQHNNNILSVITKRSYTISSKGLCENSSVAPLNINFDFKDENQQILGSDTDLYCNKPLTDLVIKGNAYSKNSEKKFQAQIEVSGQRSKLSINIFGNRFAYKDHYGKILFSEPEPVTAVPLEYNYAYGGIDLIAQEKFELPDKEILNAFPGFDWMSISPYKYPRNPVGKGYLVENNSRAFENFQLPNIEDAFIPLTPENLIVGKPQNWIYQPLARATTWVNPGWFPRIAYFGIIPNFDSNIQLNMLPEYIQKLVEPDILIDKPIVDKVNSRGSNGASPGLQFSHLSGDESIRFVNIHPQKQDFVLELPNERPRIWIDGRKGKLIQTKPVIHTIVIEPEENRITIVWRGSGPALRPYHEEELKTMPFKVEW